MSEFKEVIDIIQSVVVVTAILVGGIFALFKLQAFRDFDPHLTISHKVSHRSVSDSYTHIDVTATLHNSSKVQIELNDGFFRLQKIAPMSDETVEKLYDEVFEKEEHEELRWEILDVVEPTWGKGELVVEPGESHPETYEFIISTDVKAVLIYTYFYNSKGGKPGQNAKGWHATTIHDIVNSDR